MKKLISVLFFVSANVFAGGFSNPTNLGLVEVLTNNTIRIDAQAGQVFANPDSCGGMPTSPVLWLELDPNNKELSARQTSVLLTALTAGKKVNIYLNGCYAVPWDINTKVPKIQNIQILAN
jgi:hypothetical protein